MAKRKGMSSGNGRSLSWVAVALLAACHGDSGQAPQPKMTTRPSIRVAKPGPTPQEMTAGMVEAVTLGTSVAPVAVKFDLRSRPTVGEPLEVVVAIMAQVSSGSATVQATGSDGLQLATAAEPIEIPSIDPAQVNRLTLTMTPTADGVQLLSLNVALHHDDITETRAFSVPILVGAAGEVVSNGKH